jgi:hypothetical protein
MHSSPSSCDGGWRWQPGLVEKTPDQLCVLCQGRMQNLDSRAALDERVLGKVDITKTAFAE